MLIGIRMGLLIPKNELPMKSYDPQMHSAEHILNQTMVRLFDCGRSYSSHIEKKKSKCDYHFDRGLSREEELLIEETVNDVIDSDMLITESFLPADEAEMIYNLDRLPEDVGDEVRIVKVGEYDACPCIGPHVQSTKEIGAFSLVSSTFENGVLRIRFKLTH